MSEIFKHKVSHAMAKQLADSLKALSSDSAPCTVAPTTVSPGNGGIIVQGEKGESVVPQQTPVAAMRTFLAASPESANASLKIIALSVPAAEFGGTDAPTDPQTENARYLADVWNLTGPGGTLLDAIADVFPDAIREMKGSFSSLAKIAAKFENNRPKAVERISKVLNEDSAAGQRPGQASSMLWAAIVKPHSKMDDDGNDVRHWQLSFSTPLFKARTDNSDEAVAADLALFDAESDLHAFQAAHPEMAPRDLMFNPYCGSAAVNWPLALRGKYAGSEQLYGSVNWVIRGAKFIPARNRVVLSCYVNAVNEVALVGKNGGGGGGGSAAPVVNDEQKNLIKRTFAMATGGTVDADDEPDAKRAK